MVSFMKNQNQKLKLPGISKENIIKINLRENYEEKVIGEFFALLSYSKIENENAIVVNDLIGKGTLREYENHKDKMETVNVKKLIAKEICKILDNRLKELKENIKNENSVYYELKSHNGEVKIRNRQLRVYFGPSNYASKDQIYNDENTINHISCKITYKNFIISGTYSISSQNKYERYRKSIIIKEIIGNYTHGCVKIEIKHDFTDGSNEICIALISELINGASIHDVIPKIPVYISRFVSKKLIKSDEKHEIIKTKTQILCDNLPAVFHIKSPNKIIKVDRSNQNLIICVNGMVVNMGSLCKL